jgi:hypothetical protein
LPKEMEMEMEMEVLEAFDLTESFQRQPSSSGVGGGHGLRRLRAHTCRLVALNSRRARVGHGC